MVLKLHCRPTKSGDRKYSCHYLIPLRHKKEWKYNCPHYKYDTRYTGVVSVEYQSSSGTFGKQLASPSRTFNKIVKIKVFSEFQFFLLFKFRNLVYPTEEIKY
jgi:hypothetical protein